jgi:putative ABC transport system permease protein
MQPVSAKSSLTIEFTPLLTMIQNYLLISLRNLRKHFAYSLINIIGLSLGLATCILLVTWITHELSYDRFHKNANRLYRASMEYSFGGQTNKTALSPTALLPALEKNFPEVENGARVYNPSSYNPFVVRKDDKLFQETKFYYADSTFFEIFSFKLLEGSEKYALTKPRSLVITQTMARKYFGAEDPVGKVLLVNNRAEYTITGLMEDAPSNSLLQFDCVGSFSSLDESHDPIWWSANYQTFLLVAQHTNIGELQRKINGLVKRALASELTNPNDYVHYNFMLMTDIYLHSDVDESEVTSSIQYIYGFGGIAALILLIACINYVNLATAKAADRAREVGIRKVIGAKRVQLFLQFIGESVIITGLSFLLAFLLTQIALPFFNSLTGKTFAAELFIDPSFLLYCLIALLLIAFTAGAYPAFAITSFKPLSVLKGNFKSSGRGIWLRQGLVVFQFCISIVLVVGTLVILKQINFIHNLRLGYDKENVVILPVDRKTSEVYGQLRGEFIRSGKVIQVGRATESPTKIRAGYTINVEGATGDRGMIVTAMNADTTFIPALGMELVAGRNFNDNDVKQYRADTVFSFILNESALKELSLTTDKAIGLKVSLNGRRGEIIGVVKDFHFASIHSPISPLVLFNEESYLNFIFVKLKRGDPADALATLRRICADILPHRPFEYEFVDQKYNALYSTEERMGTIISVFSTLAIAIACLGLLGLVSFTAGQKTKEIGIRKVLGASAPNIVALITKEYALLILVSIFIGLPLAWWLIEKWFLGSFAYRTAIGVWPFVLAALSCLVSAFATASYQAIKAAFINPSDTLRNE